MHINHVDYDKRVALVKLLLEDVLVLETIKIDTIAYQNDGPPFPYNNFIYRAEVVPSESNAHAPNVLFGTQRLPQGTKELVVRLTNDHPETGLNNANRVENEVAALCLVRNHFRLKPPTKPIVPEVYAWGSARDGKQGYIVMEHTFGMPADEVFANLQEDDQRTLLKQFADLVATLQSIELPASITDFGGMTFDERGQIISGEMTLLHSGPFKTYQSLQRAKLQEAFEDAERNTVIDGWRREGLYPRIQSFIENSVEKILQTQGVRKCLVHGDFTLNNILVDPRTLQISALLDFDWAFIGIPADEYVKGFGLVEYMQNRFNDNALSKALLEDFPSPSPQEGVEGWQVAELLDEQLKEAGAERYSTLQELEGLAFLHRVSKQVAPFPLREAVVKWRSKTKENVEREKAEAAARIAQLLGVYPP